MRQELWFDYKISLNHEKTRVWNRGGFFPPGCEALQEAARLDDPGAVVWKGAELQPSQQGIKILGIPVQREYIEHFLDVRVTCQAEFLQRIPLVEDLQCAWLLLCIVGCSGPTSLFDLSPRSSHSSSLQSRQEQLPRCF